MNEDKKDGYILSVKPRHPHLRHIPAVHDNDMHTLVQKENEYDASWKRRGGVGAFMMLARKWDRLEAQVKNEPDTYNIFDAIKHDTRDEGILDDIRDLRRYLALVEAEMIEQGVVGPPAMERTNWDTLNKASREEVVAKMGPGEIHFVPNSDGPLQGIEDDSMNGTQLPSKAPWEPKNHERFRRDPDPSDRPLTEMIRRDVP